MEENKSKNTSEGKEKKTVSHKGTSSPQPNTKTSKPDIAKKEALLDLHRDLEINTMLNKIYQMKDSIQTQLCEAYETGGISSSQIKNFLNNPNNFPPETWQKIQNQRDTLEKRIRDVLKIYAKKTKAGHIIETGESKERKSKTLGARRKWIPM